MCKRAMLLAVLSVAVAVGMLAAGAVFAADADGAAATADQQAAEEGGAKKTVIWGFLWTPKTIEKRLGEALTDEQVKKISTARAEIKKKEQEAEKAHGEAQDTSSKWDPKAAYRDALKGILSATQFTKLFAKEDAAAKRTAEKKLGTAKKM